MTNPTAEINALIEQSKKFAEPLTRLTTLSIQSFEKLARHQYGVAGDALEYSIAALQTGAATKEVPEYFKSQTALAQTFVDRQTQRGQEFTKLAEEIRASYTSWFDQASAEFKAKTAKVSEAA
jgi:Phasin protein